MVILDQAWFTPSRIEEEVIFPHHIKGWALEQNLDLAIEEDGGSWGAQEGKTKSSIGNSKFWP